MSLLVALVLAQSVTVNNGMFRDTDGGWTLRTTTGGGSGPGSSVSVTNFPATQPVSGTVTATGPLTDAQLRASPVPVSGTWFPDGGAIGSVTCSNCSGGSGGGWVPDGGSIGSVNVTNDPFLAVGAFDAFGATRTAAQRNQIETNFSVAAPTVVTTVTVSGGGATAQVGGLGQFSTSAAVTAQSRGVSLSSTSYVGGSEVYAYFTAAFTTPTSAASYQRIGLYDANNGLFVGYNGTSFQACYRDATVDTCATKGAWSADQLTGAAGSRFTRNGTPEAIDLTKMNVYRVRFGWLGVAPLRFEVLSPDGAWVEFHKVLYPNTATTASIDSPNLPMTVDVSKTASDATNLVVLTGCWAAGTTGGVATTRNVQCILSTTATTSTQVTGCEVVAGHRLYITSITVGGGVATGATAPAIIQSGTSTACTGPVVLYRCGHAANTTCTISFPTPIQTAVGHGLCLLDAVAGTKWATITGYAAP